MWAASLNMARLTDVVTTETRAYGDLVISGHTNSIFSLANNSAVNVS